MKNLKFSLLILIWLVAGAASWAQVKVNGTVTDKSNEPLLGASVYIENTTEGGIVDQQGKFSISANEGETLVVSFVGYIAYSKVINASDTNLEIVLLEDLLQMEEVVITGNFDPRSKMESSVAITTISPKEMERMAYTNVADVLRSVPGVYVSTANGEAESVIYSRGMSAGAGQVGAGYRYVALQEDGLSVLPFTSDGFTPDYFAKTDISISRIEAIRGGSSSIVSGNSPGGIFNYITASGGNELSGEIRSRTGLIGEANNFMQRVDIGIGGPITKNGLTWYVGGFYRYDQGPKESPYPQNDGGQIRANIQKKWDKAILKVGFKYLNDNILLNTANFVQDWNDPTIASGTSWADNYVLPEFQAELPDFMKLKDDPTATIDFDSRNRIKVEDISANLTFSYNITENLRISNKFRYSSTSRFMNTSATTSYLDPISSPFLTQFAPLPASQFYLGGTDELLATVTNNWDGTGNFAGPSNLPLDLLGYFSLQYGDDKAGIIQDELSITGKFGNHSITAGGYFARSQFTSYSSVSATYSTVEHLPQPIRLIGKMPLPPDYTTVIDVIGSDDNGLGSRSILPRYVETTATQIAAFANDNWQISDKFNLDLGIRYEKLIHDGFREETEAIYDPVGGGLDGNPLTGYDVYYEQSTGNQLDYRFEYGTLSYSAGLNFMMNRRAALFVRYSRGNKAPWMSYHYALDVIQNEVPGETQKVDMVDLGFKLNTPKVHLFSTLFYSRLADILDQRFGFDPNQGGTYYTPAQFNTISTFGLELESVINFADWFNLNIVGTFQSSSAVEWKVWDLKNDQDMSNDELVDYSGNESSNTPKIILDITPNFNIGEKVYAFVNWRYLGARQANFANGFQLPGFSETKIGVGYDITKSFNVQLNVNNVFNSHGLMRYVGSGVGLGGFSGSTPEYVASNPDELFICQPIMPRSIYLQLSYKF